MEKGLEMRKSGVLRWKEREGAQGKDDGATREVKALSTNGTEAGEGSKDIQHPHQVSRPRITKQRICSKL